MNPIVITGMGWITPLGQSIETVWKRLLDADSGVGVNSLFDASTFPTNIAAQVRDFDLASHVADHKPHLGAGRSTQFALAAASQAWKQAGLDGAALDLDRVGIYFASGEGSLDFDAYTGAALAGWDGTAGSVNATRWAQVARQKMDVVREFEQEPNMALPHLAMLTGARGPSFNCLTACAASAQAIGEAMEILRRGDADVMISGGAHSMIHPFGVTGFNRLTALSTANEHPDRASRPFDAHRGGFVLGEGSGVVILETLEHAKKRGAKVLAQIAGYGSTADAFRITDQHPDGTGAISAMRLALADAGLDPSAVHYVSAHGTGTRENDGNETTAIKQVLGDHARNVPVSSIKSMMGHLIAAAGVVSVIACTLAIRDQIVPPTRNLDTPDPECDLDYVAKQARKHKVDVALVNAFGFGGQNDTIVVRRA
jgi:3-oxoacyl-[acyl-carrier-protein] synthase II